MILMEQKMDSPGVLLKQGHVAELVISTCGTFHVCEIRGSLFDNFLRLWGFCTSPKTNDSTSASIGTDRTLSLSILLSAISRLPLIVAR